MFDIIIQRKPKEGPMKQEVKVVGIDLAKNVFQIHATDARGKKITDYAFDTAIRELKDKGKIEAIQASGQGNRKLLQLKP